MGRHPRPGRARRGLLHDALTGLPNRRLLYERLDLALARASTGSGPLAVLFLDLDGFKAVNDAHGHDVGDELLVAVAERLQSLMRGHDMLARVGGDEFVVLCEDVGGPPGGEDVARRMVAALDEPFGLSVGEVRVGLSVGLALSGAPGARPDELVRRADAAMYDAKRAGKGRHQTAGWGA